MPQQTGLDALMRFTYMHTGWTVEWSTYQGKGTQNKSECLREAAANGPSVVLPWEIVNDSKSVEFSLYYCYSG